MTWDPVDCLSHRSLRAKTSRISSTWPSHGYGLLSNTYSMPILPCSLCMICSFRCLCHAFVTHAHIAIVASYYSCTCSSNGYVQEKRTIMMDDVFIYHAHTFFALLCACVGYLDFISTSPSRELTI